MNLGMNKQRFEVRVRGMKRMAALASMGAVVFALAAPRSGNQTPAPAPAPAPAQSGQGMSQAGTSSTTGSGAIQGVTTPPRKTMLDAALQQVKATRPKPPLVPSFTLAPITVTGATVNSTVTFNVQIYDRAAQQGAAYTYALSGAPYGSYIDPSTGSFTWTPAAPGTYTFYVWAMDNNDNTRQGFEQVTVDVQPQFLPFGYDFFAKARAVIDARMLLMRNGYFQGVQPIGNSQYSSLLSMPQLGQPTVPVATTPQNLNPWAGILGPTGQVGSGLGAGGYGSQGSTQSLQQYQPSSANPGFSPASPFAPGTQVPGLTTPGMNPQGQNNLGLSTPGLGGSSPFNGGALPNGGGYLPNANPFASSSAIQSRSNAFGNEFKNVSPLTGAIGNGQTGTEGTGSPSPQQQLPWPYGSGAPIQNTYGTPNPFMVQNLGSPFLPSTPGGVNVFPSPSPFQSIVSQLYNTPQVNGLPSGVTGMTADALRYIVSPVEMLGFDVYVPAPERYQLGPGDMLTVRIWSATLPAQDFDVKIDPRGAISLPTGNERIVLRGQTLAQAEVLLRRAVRRQIKNGDVSIQLKELRTMSIQVLGDAYLPGSYQVPAVSTLFNTLYVCGGPSYSGSLRDIQLRRTDGTARHFDMYRFLSLGDASADVPLQPGDVIFIPPVKARITIKGEVPRPAIYEALPGESVKELIDYAGGPKATGVAQRVYLETVDPGLGHTVKDVNISGSGNAPTHVYDGDIATVLSVREDLTNDLTMKGDVDQPGTYQYEKGTTVADLVTKARGLRPDAYTVRADLVRLNADKSTTLIPVDLQKALTRDPASNIELQVHDTLMVYALSDVRWMGDRQITILGAAQKPGVYVRQDGERIADLLLQAGGLMPDAFTDVAFLQRQNPDGTVGPLVKVNFKRLAAGDPTQNVVLQDHDVLTVQSTAEAHYIPEQSVNILGAVQAPGNYQRGADMRLSDLLQESGGLMPNHGNLIEITHARVVENTGRRQIPIVDNAPANDVLLEDGDLVTIPGRSDIDMRPRKVIIVGEVAKPGAYPISRTDRLSDVVARAGGLMPDAFAEGAQFYRDPALLISDVQRSLQPRLLSIFQIVAADEYTRALASSDVQKAEFLKSLNTNQTIAIPGLGNAGETSSGTVNLPANVWNETTVTQARRLTDEDLIPTGNLGIHLRSALAHRGSPDDVLLFDDDIIVVPRTPSTVSVIGAVVIPSAVKYEPGHLLDYYLTRAGGITNDASKDQILVIRAGGGLEHANRYTKIGLGDQIYVPTKVQVAKFQQQNAALDNVSKTILTGAIVIALIRSLIR